MVAGLNYKTTSEPDKLQITAKDPPQKIQVVFLNRFREHISGG